MSNAKAQQVLLSSVPGDGDVQVAFVFLSVTVTLRCTKLLLRFWSLSLHWPRACKKGLALVHANLFAIAHAVHSGGADTVQKACSLKGQTNEIKSRMSW